MNTRKRDKELTEILQRSLMIVHNAINGCRVYGGDFNHERVILAREVFRHLLGEESFLPSHPYRDSAKEGEVIPPDPAIGDPMEDTFDDF